MVGATDWASCSAKTSGADLSGGCVTDAQRYVQYQVTLESSGASTPTFSDISIAFTPSDQSRPSINASSIAITGLTNGSWTNTEPTLTWTAGTDNTAVVGYCISLDEQVVDATPSAGLNPETSSGKLVGLDDGITNLSTCPYIVAGTTVNLSSISGLTLTSNKQYWFSIKAVDAAGNVANDSAGPWQDLVSFKYDGFKPTNPSISLSRETLSLPSQLPLFGRPQVETRLLILAAQVLPDCNTGLVPLVPGMVIPIQEHKLLPTFLPMMVTTPLLKPMTMSTFLKALT